MIYLSDQQCGFTRGKGKGKWQSKCVILPRKPHILDVLHDSLASLANTASVAVLLQLKKKFCSYTTVDNPQSPEWLI